MSAKILIVDDSTSFRQLLSFTLRKSGYSVLEAEDGLEGIAQFDANADIVLVISDVHMPNMDGLAMLASLKSGPRHQVPVIMLTSNNSAEHMALAKDRGAKAWLGKPFNPAVLIQALSRILAA